MNIKVPDKSPSTLMSLLEKTATQTKRKNRVFDHYP